MVFHTKDKTKTKSDKKAVSLSEVQRKNRLLRNVALDYINTFITNLNMQSSIWVLYLAYCGLNLAQIGVVEGIYHATGILF